MTSSSSATPTSNSVSATSTPANTERAAASSSSARVTWPLFVLFCVTAGVVGAVVSAGFLGESLAALGIPDPGPLTTAGLPFFRAAAWMLAALSVGSFLFAGFLCSPRELRTPTTSRATTPRTPTAPRNNHNTHNSQDNSNNHPALRFAILSADGTVASKTGAVAALCFGLIALLMVPMYLSDVSGQPLADAMQPQNWSTAINQVSTSLAWQWSAVFALVTGVAALTTHRWIMQPVWLCGAVLMIVPLGLEGHSASGGDHDYGTNSYLWHAVFMVLWVGGLMALIAHGRRRGPGMVVAVRRYSAVALASALVMTLSGLINAAIRIHWSDWFTTSYGTLILTKTVGVVVLIMMGWLHRQATIPKLEKQPRLFQRVAIVEVLVMAAITGVAVSLGRTPPPPPREPDLNTMDIQLGYKLFVEPTIWNVWTMWRFDIIFGTLAILLAIAYMWGVRRLRLRGEPWPWYRTAWFMSGCVMLLVTMCSGIGMNMPATFSMHMVGHMILSMGVPVFWVLGGPFTLWLAAINPGQPGQPGPREWLEVAINNPVVRFLTHPAVNTIQFLVVFYILYLTPLYDVAVSEHAGHLTMNIMFLWSGFMYYWEVIGVDPVPVERNPMGKGAWLFGSLPFHMWFGVALMQMQVILAYDFYSTLGLPWHVDLLRDQNVGGGIAWAAGQFPLIIVVGAVVLAWYRDDHRQMRTYDKRADETDDEDMAAYNAMLAQINAGENPFEEYYAQDMRGRNDSST